MHKVVKILAYEYGDVAQNPVWCLSDPTMPGGSPCAFCSGQVYGEGEGDAVFEEKLVKRGGITCPDCLKKLRELKAVKL